VNSQDSNTTPSNTAVKTCSVTRCYAFLVDGESCTNALKFCSFEVLYVGLFLRPGRDLTSTPKLSIMHTRKFKANTFKQFTAL